MDVDADVCCGDCCSIGKDDDLPASNGLELLSTSDVARGRAVDSRCKSTRRPR